MDEQRRCLLRGRHWAPNSLFLSFFSSGLFASPLVPLSFVAPTVRPSSVLLLRADSSSIARLSRVAALRTLATERGSRPARRNGADERVARYLFGCRFSRFKGVMRQVDWNLFLDRRPCELGLIDSRSRRLVPLALL